jgi:very-short-patch-repair endonuclease
MSLEGANGVISRIQLLAFGFTDQAIRHRLARGRLRRIYPGVYAVGQLPFTRQGEWIAAQIACGETAALSEGIVLHRRTALRTTTHDGIRVTTPPQTLIDLARNWPTPRLEQAIGEADLRRLVTLKALRTEAKRAGRPAAALRAVIERLTFRVTQSELERAFLRVVAKAGLPLPDTQTRFGEMRVDFHWPATGLVVEADDARFHANAIQQQQDRKRDQAHIRAGRIPMRVTHWQVVREPVETTTLLVDVFTACECRRGSASSKRAA